MPASAPEPRQAVDSPAMCVAGKDLLSLALIDARNHTLHLLSCYEEALGSQALTVPHRSGEPCVLPPLWLAGHVGWFAEWWIARNTQRAFGADCPQRPTRLASIAPAADFWWDPRSWSGEDPALPDARWSSEAPDVAVVRSYLRDTLECTLELLERAAETDAGLYFYRLALFHEDLRGEQLVMCAQTLGLPLQWEPQAVAEPREPLWLPPTRWQLGSPATGFCFSQERGRLEVDVPEFEIDAQPVTWQQFAEFVDDGGYDQEALWQPAGRAWLAQQIDGRRAPRHVEQIGAGRAVLRHRFGRLVQAPGHQPAMHLSWWEADAWARWAGRRLATEVEWEVAAHAGAHRGFRWGEVQEWTAGTLQPWPGYVADPWSQGTDFDAAAAFGQARVVRGTSFAARARLRSPRRRGFALPPRDDAFIGFRTCAV
ncbi:SUMF1/EgtB/PvdO family nonheme iron enzyme [Variovorax ginsengisoli]|uniref:Ergothioneine biosynthesis protein EgtB n=1 Tax=Variovorax ginsengisoli TaxID=363844 RepID=A0ABT9S1A4_9BURK|nr:SUMF1/EgtB/PvdO family nonheme iron enzyme [Variovorax ginsengisoli]MDP9898134.1 ergothioneine biosynthesis protein EgtB [Variovorax ginsengisoli]